MAKPPKIKSGLLSRTFSTAKLSTRLGLGAAKRMLNKEVSPADNAVEVITKLADEFDSMKGLIMKFGQMASTLGAHLPEDARAALAKLQSDATAMPFESVRSCIEAELGKPIESAFDSFEEKAFAAASIGQVHRAKIKGQSVAVKVQYPDIEKILKIDLKVVGHLFSTLTMGSALDGRGLAKELSKHVLDECDYLKEAENQIRVKKLCESQHINKSEYNTNTQAVDSCNLGAQYVPDVISSHSSLRVLTTEYVDAMSFDEFRHAATQPIKNKAALTIFAHSFSAIFSHCYFNGDPHPGNYLFHPDGSVTFLDFGCVKKFDLSLINTWKRLAKSVLEQDKNENFQVTQLLNLIGKNNEFNHDFHWEFMNHLYQPYRQETPFRYTKQFNAKTNQYLLWDNKNRFSAKMPPDFLFINRLQWGLAALLADLNAEAIWSSPFQHVVYGPASPLFTEPNSSTNGPNT